MGIFYPENLSPKKFLPFYAATFDTAEVNYSFYHLPKVTTYENWYAATPTDFVFTLKLSRYITHIKRLNDVKQPWKEFLKGARSLREKLVPYFYSSRPASKAPRRI